MRAEHIQEALNLLPDDLIEKVDALRSRKAAPVYRGWKQLGAIAACLAVLILGTITAGTLFGGRGGSSEFAADTALEQHISQETVQEAASATQAHSKNTAEPEEADLAVPEPFSYSVTARSFQSDSLWIPEEQSPVTVFRSRQELDSYCAAGGLDQLLQLTSSYDEAYFSENDLILTALGFDSGSACFEINTLVSAGDRAWELQGKKSFDEPTTCDLVPWHALVEIPKAVIDPEDTVTLQISE